MSPSKCWLGAAHIFFLLNRVGAVSYTHLIESETKEDTIEPGTETLAITADPRSDGLVKARTGDTTDSGTYTNWYKAVYTPTEEEPEEISGEDESV